jgi:hypothetical protein
MTRAPRLITIEFLVWVAAAPRRIAEAREAWRSTCPLTCAWEDAISDGLVDFADAHIVLTAAGRAVLDAAGRASLPLRLAGAAVAR